MAETVYILLTIVIIGMAVLFVLTVVLPDKKEADLPPVIGTIVIETSDPDGPFLFLDLDVPVDQIGTYQKVVCRVDTNGIVGKESE